MVAKQLKNALINAEYTKIMKDTGPVFTRLLHRVPLDCTVGSIRIIGIIQTIKKSPVGNRRFLSKMLFIPVCSLAAGFRLARI